MNIDIVITRHQPLVDYLREQGLIGEDTPVLAHASISDVKGKHVIGVLPHHLSQHAASISEVPMSLTPEDRVAMQKGDLSLERVREVAGRLVTYQVFGGVGRASAILDAIEDKHDPVLFTLRCISQFERMRWCRRGSWGDDYHKSDSVAIQAQVAARNTIPWDLCGPPVRLPRDVPRVVDWHTACGHSAAEADTKIGAFRAYASGPGWSAWIDVTRGAAIGKTDAEARGLDTTAYDSQPRGYPY